MVNHPATIMAVAKIQGALIPATIIATIMALAKIQGALTRTVKIPTVQTRLTLTRIPPRLKTLVSPILSINPIGLSTLLACSGF